MVGPAEVVPQLRAMGLERGAPLALVIAPGRGLGLATVAPSEGALGVATDDPAGVVAEVEAELRPRWVVWSQVTALQLVAAGVEVATAWDLAAVHRLLHGGTDDRPEVIWATLAGLGVDALPATVPVDLFHQASDSDEDHPIRPDGHLDPDWVGGDWALSATHMSTWAGVLADAAHRQLVAMGERDGGPMLRRTARAESTVELLCAELAVHGLPMDRAAMEATVAGFVGPRARSEGEAAELRRRRDDEVLRHVPLGIWFDLRSPTQVRSMLRTVGVEVPDTRAWRLESLRDVHPLVDALLVWRKAERVATTFGYAWLDQHLGADGRFRGSWSGSDGAAGRMTASAGLHNMPADLRRGVVAEPGHVFVRADLGQIEPRVLALVSGDRALAEATSADDLYAPVAAELGVDRATAKVAVLGAMYGQTTGEGARALVGLRRSYPVAMAYLEAADRSGQVGQDLRTYGGRLVPMGSANVGGMGDREARARAAARGRFGRNAMIQGAAAELFKVWAVVVRARGVAHHARVVLCLHDELLVHVPEGHAVDASAMVDGALAEAARRCAPDTSVRFLAETTTIVRWSDAKA